MPRTKDRPKWAPRRVTDEKERSRGGFIQLKKVGDKFLGYALFLPDPKADDNPGYYEYWEHYTPATGYCACAGDDCPICDEGDNPSTRAKTLWLVVDDPDDVENGEVKTFNINYYMITDFADLHQAEDEPVLGQLFRITKQEGNGKFLIRPKKEKLTKTQLKEALKGAPDLERIVTSRMAAVFEEMGFADAMEEDDEDDESEEKGETKARRGRPKGSKNKPKDEEPEDDDDDDEPEPAAEFDPDEEDEIDEQDVTVVSLKKKDNIAKVALGDVEFNLYGTDEVDLTGFAKGEVITVSAAKDEDGDFVASSAEASSGEGPEEEESEDGGEVPDELENETVAIVSVNPSPDDTLTVKMSDGTEFDLFFLDSGEDENGNDWADLDLNDFSEDQEVVISASKDSEGDMLASVFPEPVKKAKKKAGKK